jgi:hypothetical protein
MKDDLEHVHKLKLTSTTAATAYSFRREDGQHGDWAICTVNDATGELSIQSDWGSWTHRWGSDPKHLGAPTLTAFIADRSSCHYLAGKLSAEEGRQAARRFDAEATIAEFRGLLLERRKDDAKRDRRRGGGFLDRETARYIWDELGRLDHDNADELIRGFYEIEDASKFVSEEPYHHLASRPTGCYLVLLHGILPALVTACAAEQARRIEAGQVLDQSRVMPS